MPIPVLALSISQELSELGYAGLLLLMIAETVFPPIPSEVVLPLAGYLVQKGDFEFLPTLVASTFGSLVGAVILEELARHGGRPFAERFLRFAHPGRGAAGPRGGVAPPSGRGRVGSHPASQRQTVRT